MSEMVIVRIFQGLWGVVKLRLTDRIINEVLENIKQCVIWSLFRACNNGVEESDITTTITPYQSSPLIVQDIKQGK